MPLSKKCFALALTLTLSPGEREQPLDAALKFPDCGAEDSRGFAKTLGAFLPLLGERAGVREVVTTNSC